MVKTVIVFSIKDGVDPDKVWKHWMDVHAVPMTQASGLRRYVINRVIKKLPNPDGSEGAKYWGIAEMWFDTEADSDRAMNAANRNVDDEWISFVGLPSSAIVEEVVLAE